MHGETVEVVDIPGTYSLQTSDEAESLAVHFLLHEENSPIIINVIDASVLSRSLELTLQLAELQKPMVVALNMIDEAEKKGITIDIKKLEKSLGVPIITTIGKKGRGVFELFELAYSTHKKNVIPHIHSLNPKLEQFITNVTNVIIKKKIPSKWNSRFISIKILEKDPLIKEHLEEYLSDEEWNKINALLSELEKQIDTLTEYSISGVRHNLAFSIFENVAEIGHVTRTDIRYKIDNVLMHPVFGYIFMAGILAMVFYTIFFIGNAIEPLFLQTFESGLLYLKNSLGSDTILFSISQGLVTGIGGGVGIVIPYLLPFFIFLSFLEDSGYLARIAYLIDNIMHKIGLHGLSVIPLILGYGCTVPGILATRILKSPRDKFITATITTLVPCSARMTIIFGLVGFFISIKAAVAIYLLNLVLIGISGKILAKVMPEVSPGLILEIPKYHLPGIKIIANKTWFRLKEFIVIAWPLLVAGSIVLEMVNHFGWTESINSFLQPLTSGILGLPAVLGVTLLFGILRKELALILLFTALGTQDVASVMTETQIFSYTLFITFYLPCLATFAALARELKYKNALLITLFTIIIAISIVLILRLIGPMVF